MRTTINVSDGLIREVVKESRAKTLTQAIRAALEGYLEHRKRMRLIKSFGSFSDWKPDIRAMRKNRGLG